MTFTIKPFVSLPYYYDVIVFSRFSDFISYTKLPSRSLACFVRYTSGDKIGELVFCKKHYEIGVVSHECLHAAIHFFRRRNIIMKTDGRFDKRREEKLCYLQAALVDIITKKLKPKINKENVLMNLHHAKEYYN